MVTPALKPLFEAEGIPLIAPESGARALVEELRAAGARPVEVVISVDASEHTHTARAAQG